MTLLDGLAFVLSVATVPVAFSVLPWSSRRWFWRTATSLFLVSLGLNSQFNAHPWQSWLVLVLALVAANLPSAGLRWPLLLVLALGGPVLLDPGIVPLAGNQLFGPQRVEIVLVTAGFLFAVLSGSTFVEQVLKRLKGLPGSSEEAEGTIGAPAGGKIIGMLERAFAYGGVLLGHPEAAALVVAVKSVARFPEFNKPATGRRFAEYFLIGTLLSIGFALSVAYLISAALTKTH